MNLGKSSPDLTIQAVSSEMDLANGPVRIPLISYFIPYSVDSFTVASNSKNFFKSLRKVTQLSLK